MQTPSIWAARGDQAGHASHHGEWHEAGCLVHLTGFSNPGAAQPHHPPTCVVMGEGTGLGAPMDPASSTSEYCPSSSSATSLSRLRRSCALLSGCCGKG